MTTNLVNGKRYVGLHRGDFNSEYHGSGKLIKEALKKYGHRNFKTELIEYCETEEKLNERERYWIKFYNASLDNNFYNLSNGGEGFGGLSGDLNPSKREDVKKKMRGPRPQISGENNYWYGKHLPPEVREKISKTKIQNKSHLGNNNPMYGKHGQDNPNYGRVHVHIDTESITIPKEKLEYYLSIGYEQGRLSDKNPPMRDKCYVNNGIYSIVILKTQLNKCLSKGWIRGKKNCPVNHNININECLIGSSTIESIGNEKDITE